MLQEKFLTIPEAADKLGLSPQRVWRFVQEGRLKATKMHPRLWVIREEDLEEFSKEERRPGRPPKKGRKSA